MSKKGKIPTPDPAVIFPTKGGKKSVNFRSDPVILARLAAVAEMINRGAKVHQIAAAFNGSIATARRDITRVRLLWREDSLARIDDKRDESVAQYKLVVTRAWDEYHKTKNARFLQVVLEAQGRIDDVEGTRAAQEIKVTPVLDVEKIRASRWANVIGQLAQVVGDEPLPGEGS